MRRDTIRLSGKEVAGLAARVLTSAHLPSGSVGSASEAIEFLELTNADGLARLDTEKGDFGRRQWRAPEIVCETASSAICDGGDCPVLFYGAALADWLAAMVNEGASAAIGLRGGENLHYLSAIPYFLANRGLSGVVVEFANQPGNSGIRISATLSSSAGWLFMRRSYDLSVASDESAERITNDEALALLSGLCGDVREWLQNLTSKRALPGISRLLSSGTSAALFGFNANDVPVAKLNPGDFGAAFAISSADYHALKKRILAEGWSIDASLWERLMGFADRSLIKTSERSRLGAG